MEQRLKKISGFPILATILLATGVWVYEVMRAVRVGFTHDESSSFLNFADAGIKDLFFNKVYWNTANNHLINSLCMQAGYHFFGAQEWALRWGSLVAGLLFLIYAFRCVRLWLPDSSWLFFGSFCVFALNPYTTEFFALCRGYGWCLGFEMAALYYFFHWIKQEATSDLLKSATALSFGILSNFILLDLLAAFFVTVTAVYCIRQKNKRSFSGWLQLMILPALPVLVTVVLIFQPMRWISANGEFEWGPKAFWETWRVLIQQFMFKPLSDTLWLKVCILAFGTLFFVVLGYKIFRRFKTGGIDSHPSLFYAAVLTLTTMFVTMAQHYLLGANYLISRTAVLFYPLLSSVVVLYLTDRQKNAKPILLPILIVAGVVVNFGFSANLRFCREWPYDEYTKAVVLAVDQQGDPEHKIKYGVGWEFYPATRFYQVTRKLDHMEPVEYNQSHDDVQWVNEHPFERIYILDEFRPKMERQYTLERQYGMGLLMKRK